MATDSGSAAEPARDRGALTMRSLCEGDIHVIALAGELDLATAADLDQELRRVELTDALVVAVDLRELTFIDSTGIRLILQAQARSSEGGHRLILIRGTDAIQRPFEICDLANRLPFTDQLPFHDTATGSTTEAARSGVTAQMSRVLGWMREGMFPESGPAGR